MQTFVLECNGHWAREVIMREVGRKGQVYFVYNHVLDIDQFLVRLHALMPEVRIGVAHGQMRESQLEKVMVDFYAKFDVLLCSTIIESGLDIPNVNSIIVYDADHLGLAQLYQLRGRVGRQAARLRLFHLPPRQGHKRSGRKSGSRRYAYRVRRRLQDRDARPRDTRRRQCTGPAQHGHMSEVGYDMYCKLVDQAVRNYRAKVQERVRP